MRLTPPLSPPGPPRHFRAAPLLALALSACSGPPEGAGLGQRLPVLPLTDRAGQAAPLPDGPATLVLVWATWCRPCEALAREQAALPLEGGAELVHIALGGAEAVDAAVATDWGLPGEPRHTAERPLTVAWAVDELPLLLLLDGRGVLRSRGQSWADTRRAASELLAHDD